MADTPKVVEFKQREADHIPTGLRNLANAIENGEMDPDQLAWILYDSASGSCRLGILGKCTNPPRDIAFLFGLGMHLNYAKD